MEEDQIIKFRLDKDDEQLYQSDPDSDVEIDGSEIDEGEITESHVEMEDEVVMDTSQPISPQQEVKDNRERLNQIDQEMRMKVKELHRIMTDGGLVGATDMLNQCFDVSSGEVRTGKSPATKGKVNPANLSDRTKQLNVNDNRSNNDDYRQAMLVRSIETIYKNAVDKRNSSSSEDGIDISDDSIGLGFLVDKRAVNKTGEVRSDNLPSTSGHQ